MRPFFAVAACAALIAPVIEAAAEPLDIRPGLWDMTKTLTVSGAPPYVEGLSVNSEYAAMWKKSVGKPETERDYDCLTKEDIDGSQLFEDMQKQGMQCERTTKTQSARTWVVTVECQGNKQTTRMQLDVTSASSDRMKGSIKSTTTSPNGVTVMDIKVEGRWVAESCEAPEEDAEEGEETSDEDGE